MQAYFIGQNQRYGKKKPEGFSEKNSIVKIPNHRIQDIDTLDDWKRAEIIYKIKNRENS